MADLTLGGLSSGLSGAAAENLNRGLGVLAAVVLLPFCLYSLSGLFWQLYYPDRIAAAFDIAAPKAGKAAARAPKAASWDWFAVREAPKKKAVAAKINAQLMGVFGVGDEGVAMISVNRGKMQNFRVGDEITDGVVLGKLAQSHVILLRGESEEVLAMKKTNLFQAKQEDGMIVGAGPTGISRGTVQKMIREQPLQLAQMLKFEATDTSRYGRGMKISARRSENESMLYNMGLIPGDIVIRVNGKNVDHYRKNPNSWRPLLQGGKLRLELVRNGTLQNVTLELGR